MNNLGYLALANFVIFSFFFVYLLSLQKKNSSLRKEIELLKVERKDRKSETQA